MTSLTLLKPDDWHVHLRDGNVLQHTVQASAAHFQRALVMPNLLPPLEGLDALSGYQARVLKHCPPTFAPFFTLFLRETTTPQTLIDAAKRPDVLGAKLYPKGATTHSDLGVSTLKTLYPLFDVMQYNDLVLQIHGETTKDDIFHREAKFIEQSLAPLCAAFPKLRIVLEHISTQVACDFVKQASNRVAATITVHHLMYNRNDLLSGGIKPHLYCLPILKTKMDQQAVQQAALSGNNKFFLGTDSAPHALHDKETRCGCAGIYSSPYALSLYATFFESFDALERLEAFSSHFGADFYQLPRNNDKITLIKQNHRVPDHLSFGDQKVIPIEAGKFLHWTIIND